MSQDGKRRFSVFMERRIDEDMVRFIQEKAKMNEREAIHWIMDQMERNDNWEWYTVAMLEGALCYVHTDDFKTNEAWNSADVYKPKEG